MTGLPGYGWLFLGSYIAARSYDPGRWPVSSLNVLGLFLGIDFVVPPGRVGRHQFGIEKKP